MCSVMSSSPLNHRSCWASPAQRSVGLITDITTSEQTPNTTNMENVILPETASQMRNLQKYVYWCKNRVDNSSQSSPECVRAGGGASRGVQWSPRASAPSRPELEDDVGDEEVDVCEVPAVRTVARRACVWRAPHLEVRRPAGRLLCAEYTARATTRAATRAATLRAYYALTPRRMPEIPSALKTQLDIDDKPIEHKLEIIDENIADNQVYLSDIKKLLQRKSQWCDGAPACDVRALYDMARRGCAHGVPARPLTRLTRALLDRSESTGAAAAAPPPAHPLTDDVAALILDALST